MRNRKGAPRRPSSLEEHEETIEPSSGVCSGAAVRTVIQFRDPTESELQQADSSTDPGSIVLELSADQVGVPGPGRSKAVEELAERLMIRGIAYGEAKILVDRRDPNKVVIHDLHKGTTHGKERKYIRPR